MAGVESFYALFGKMPIRELHIILEKKILIQCFYFKHFVDKNFVSAVIQWSVTYSQPLPAHMDGMKKLADRKDAFAKRHDRRLHFILGASTIWCADSVWFNKTNYTPKFGSQCE